jgi:hypothetical protein
MAEVEKSPFENLIAGPSRWPEAYHQLQQFIGARRWHLATSGIFWK